MIKIYAAMENSNLADGNGPLVPRGYFLEYEDCVTFIEECTSGVMGVGVGKVRIIEVYENLEEHPKWTKNKVRQHALAKLTDYEKEVLGLT